MRIVFRGLVLAAASLALSGCTAGYIAGGTAAWVASEKFTNRSPLEHASLALKPNCDAYSLYDMPPHCRWPSTSD
jgi:hypothetical protein